MSEFVDAPVKEEVDEDVTAMFDLSKKKKKKKKKVVDDPDAADGATDANDASTSASSSATAGGSAENGKAGADTQSSPPTYTYSDMLTRVFDLLHANNPELQNKRKFQIKTPQLARVGTKKTVWSNFAEICSMMRRNPDHVFQFMMAELGTEGSIDGNSRLVIRGKFVPKYIESLLRKYIGEYVTCHMCRSFNTTLKRDPTSRLYFVECIPAESTGEKGGCGSSRSVAQIRAGYHAQTRADRRALRNAPAK